MQNVQQSRGALTLSSLPPSIRYLLVGGASAVLDFVTFRSLLAILGSDELHIARSLSILPEQLGNIAGMAVAFVFNFLLHRYWSFQSNGNALRQVVLVLALLLVNSLIGCVAIAFLIRHMHIDPSPAKLLLQAAVVAWNYLIYKHVIYGSQRKTWALR